MSCSEPRKAAAGVPAMTMVPRSHGLPAIAAFVASGPKFFTTLAAA